MQSLREQQAGFAAAILSSTALGVPGIRADGISPAARLGFYRTNVLENYRKALAATYPVVMKLVGSGFFGVLASEYVVRQPSRFGDVGRHGEQFPEFLRRHASARELPYLSDVAHLEWCMEESFNEADHAPLSLARLAAVPEEHHGRLRFLLAPSCRLLSSRFPVLRIWEVCQPDFESEVAVDLRQGAVNVLVRRQGFSVIAEAVPSGEFAMLSALAGGEGFAEGYECGRREDSGFDPAAFLQKYILSCVLVDFAVPADGIE
jgi:hypothetical protein